MKVCVTGGAGFVGSVLCRRLLEQGHKVRCLDNLSRGDGDSLLDIINHKNFEFIFGDVTKYDDCVKVVDGVDAIIHLAGLVGAPKCSLQPALSRSINVDGTVNMLRARSKDQRFVFASTGSVYGKVEGTCDENSPCNPLSEYGIHKLIAEDEVCGEENTIAFRFATGFGVSPCMRVKLLPNTFVYNGVFDNCITVFQPDAMRTFIPVQEMGRTFIWGLEERQHKIYNVGNEKFNLTKRELANKVSELTGCATFFGEHMSDPDQRDYGVLNSLIEKENFVIQGSMEEEIKKLIKTVPLLHVHNRYA